MIEIRKKLNPDDLVQLTEKKTGSTYCISVKDFLSITASYDSVKRAYGIIKALEKKIEKLDNGKKETVIVENKKKTTKAKK